MKEKKVTREKNLEVLLGEFRNKHEEYFGWCNKKFTGGDTFYGLFSLPETNKECKDKIPVLKKLIEFYHALTTLEETYPSVVSFCARTLLYSGISLHFSANKVELQFGKDCADMGIKDIKSLLNFAERMLSEVIEIQEGLGQKVYQKHYSDFVWVMGNRAVKESKV